MYNMYTKGKQIIIIIITQVYYYYSRAHAKY